ncbi:MAG: NAD-dependent deacylase [Cytophagales bacterium]|nr:MAG: NAD-dependent deacylase [Cytophagales bacterium]TAF61732.1 MAG: NAD-dependent deacylase [Cytophagales bacterium]
MNRKLKLVVLSGAGISAESGIPTFRASDGLWENHRIEDVASPSGWYKNPALVLDFYNQRRKNALKAEPNLAHQLLAKLENFFDVHIITQNVDDLHERGGSTKVLHIHGELKKSRSTKNENLVFDVPPPNYTIELGDVCPLGSQLRPHIVWFGESVPLMEEAAEIASTADIFVVVGTSLAVYPAANLIHCVRPKVSKYIIDPNTPEVQGVQNKIFFAEKATMGMQKLYQILAKDYGFEEFL